MTIPVNVSHSGSTPSRGKSSQLMQQRIDALLNLVCSCLVEGALPVEIPLARSPTGKDEPGALH